MLTVLNRISALVSRRAFLATSTASLLSGVNLAGALQPDAQRMQQTAGHHHGSQGTEH